MDGANLGCIIVLASRLSPLASRLSPLALSLTLLLGSCQFAPPVTQPAKLTPQVSTLSSTELNQKRKEFFSKLRAQKLQEKGFSIKNHVDHTYAPPTTTAFQVRSAGSYHPVVGQSIDGMTWLSQPTDPYYGRYNNTWLTTDYIGLPFSWGLSMTLDYEQRVKLASSETPDAPRVRWDADSPYDEIILSGSPDGSAGFSVGSPSDSIYCSVAVYYDGANMAGGFYPFETRVHRDARVRVGSGGSNGPLKLGDAFRNQGYRNLNGNLVCTVEQADTIQAFPESETQWWDYSHLIFNGTDWVTQPLFYPSNQPPEMSYSNLYVVNPWSNPVPPSYTVEITADPKTFYPGSGTPEWPGTINFNLDTGPNEETWVEVYGEYIDPYGNVYWKRTPILSHVASPDGEGSRVVTWDGKDDQGNYLPPGNYVAFSYSYNWDDFDTFTIAEVPVVASPTPTPSPEPTPTPLEECPYSMAWTPSGLQALEEKLNALTLPIQEDINKYQQILNQISQLDQRLIAEGVLTDTPSPAVSVKAQRLLDKKAAFQTQKTQLQVKIQNDLQLTENHRQELSQQINQNLYILSQADALAQEKPNSFEAYKQALDLDLTLFQDDFEGNLSSLLEASETFVEEIRITELFLQDYLYENFNQFSSADSGQNESYLIEKISDIQTPRQLLRFVFNRIQQQRTKLIQEKAQVSQDISLELEGVKSEVLNHLEDLDDAITLSLIAEGVIHPDTLEYQAQSGFSIQQYNPNFDPMTFIWEAAGKDLNAANLELKQKKAAFDQAKGKADALIDQIPIGVMEQILKASFDLQDGLGTWDEMKRSGQAQQILDGYRNVQKGMQFAGLLPEKSEDIALMMFGIKQAKGTYKAAKYGTEGALASLRKWRAANKGHKAMPLVEKKIKDLEAHAKKFQRKGQLLGKKCVGNKNQCAKYYQQYKNLPRKVSYAEICAQDPKRALCTKFPQFKNFSIHFDDNGIPDFTKVVTQKGGPTQDLTKGKTWIKASTAELGDAASKADQYAYSKVYQKDFGNTLAKDNMTGHHSGNLRYNAQNELEVEIQFVPKDLHAAFQHTGGFEYYRSVLGLSSTRK